MLANKKVYIKKLKIQIGSFKTSPLGCFKGAQALKIRVLISFSVCSVYCIVVQEKVRIIWLG
jgi:hypothetical protein